MLRAFTRLGAAATLLVCACSPVKTKPKLPPPVVGVVTIREQPVALSVELPGRTSPYAMAEIRPQVSGLIRKRLFAEGAAVKPGQPLYQIEPGPYQAIYDKAQAARASAQGRAKRYAALIHTNAIAAQTNDDAQFAWQQAQADAQAARINLAYTRVVSPIGGRIGASSVTEGALVTAQQATPLATVSALDPIYVDIDQSSAEFLALRRAAMNGQVDDRVNATAPARLKLQDGTLYAREGRLQFSEVMVDPTTGSVRLRAIFPNPEGVLLPGMYVRAILTQARDPHGLLAPQHGVGRNEKGEPTVFVLDRRNVAQLRVIQTGRAVGPYWQVLSGLKPGDRMIADGLLRVKTGMKVSPRPLKLSTGP